MLSSRQVLSGTFPTHLSKGLSPTVPGCPMPSYAVPCRLPPSSVVFCFFSSVPRHPPLFPAFLHHPRPSPTIPYQNMSQIVRLVVLPNNSRPGNSRTRTDSILSSCLAPRSWQPPGRLRTLIWQLHLLERSVGY